jgi:alpha-N-arabinofuranosidase
MDARILVTPGRKIGDIDPMIYGQFLSRRRWVSDEGLFDPGHRDARPDGLRRGVVEAVRETAPPVLRWPGGCTGTSYEWLDGVGPRQQRPRVIDAHFGYPVGNGFGTAEFVAFCRELGAEPQLNLTTGTGSLREALAWVEYANLDTDTKWASLRREHGHQAPFGVKFWQIGNEEWGPWEIGQVSARDNAVRAREWAKSIKKLDSTVKVLALGGGGGLGTIREWLCELMREAGEHIDYVTQHRYWGHDSRAGRENYEEIVSTGALEERLMIDLAGMIDMIAAERGLHRKPRLAYTEWNCVDLSHREMSPSWRPTTSQYRLVDALACAGFLNAMQRQCNGVGLANFAQTLNVVGMLVVTPEQVLRETVFWALAMQRHHSGSVAVDAWTECGRYAIDTAAGPSGPMPWLDVSATLDPATGRCFVSIVNCHRDQECATTIDGAGTGGATLIRLWDADPFARNTFEAPERIRPVEERLASRDGRVRLTLPPHSYSIVEVQP